MDPSTQKAARAILLVFREKELRAGDFVNFADFGKVLRWEAGYVKHENQREALRYLVEHAYVIELNSGLELTHKGQKVLNSL
jgi:hypothetical protein